MTRLTALLGRIHPGVRRLIRERDAAVRELASRGREVDLLYTIGEFLGGTTDMAEVADRMLDAVAGAIGADRAVFLQWDRASMALTPLALWGMAPGTYPAIPLDDASHLAVRALRADGACRLCGEAATAADPLLAPGQMSTLAVPIVRPRGPLQLTGTFAIPSPSGTMDAEVLPLGVLAFAKDEGRVGFSGDAAQLAEAVCRQIATVMQNAMLMKAALERQQFVREMRLAHELQLKLLPDPSVLGPEGRAAIHMRPAESVGGDFFHFVRLDRDRTGVMIGDVSGHGFQSALVMTLALSAAAIHLQSAFDPAVALTMIEQSLYQELVSTDMSIALCYAVIDTRAGELRYANAGHPHAFVLRASGGAERLRATVPPLGFNEGPHEEGVTRWQAGDCLLLFTDGVADARGSDGSTLGEAAVLEAVQSDASAPVEPRLAPEARVRRMADRLAAHVGSVPLRDDCTVVVVDRT